MDFENNLRIQSFCFETTKPTMQRSLNYFPLVYKFDFFSNFRSFRIVTFSSVRNNLITISNLFSRRRIIALDCSK